MVRSVAYFPLQCALNSAPVMSAVLDSLRGAGIQTLENSMTADCAVIWSVLWHGRMKPNQQIYQHYRSQNKPVIVIETGALHRGITWKVAINNITSTGYYGNLENLDWDRPSKLKICLETRPATRPNIVIAAQHQNSLQVDGIDMSTWVKDTVASLKKHTDRPISVRPHPRCKLQTHQLPPDITIEQPQRLPNTYDSFDMRFDCHAVVNYNSGPGIQAAIAGIRPVVDASSLAHPVGIEFADIEQPYVKDRQLWLTQICHTEYTVNELREGLWLKRLSPALQVQ